MDVELGLQYKSKVILNWLPRYRAENRPVSPEFATIFFGYQRYVTKVPIQPEVLEVLPSILNSNKEAFYNKDLFMSWLVYYYSINWLDRVTVYHFTLFVGLDISVYPHLLAPQMMTSDPAHAYDCMQSPDPTKEPRGIFWFYTLFSS